MRIFKMNISITKNGMKYIIIFVLINMLGLFFNLITLKTAIIGFLFFIGFSIIVSIFNYLGGV